jgi:hypothetical protein
MFDKPVYLNHLYILLYHIILRPSVHREQPDGYSTEQWVVGRSHEEALANAQKKYPGRNVTGACVRMLPWMQSVSRLSETTDTQISLEPLKRYFASNISGCF